MTTAKAFSFFTFLMLMLSSCSEEKGSRTISGKAYAVKKLKFALGGKTLHNVIENSTIIIKDSCAE